MLAFANASAGRDCPKLDDPQERFPMSWVDVLWPMMGAASLTLAVIHASGSPLAVAGKLARSSAMIAASPAASFFPLRASSRSMVAARRSAVIGFSR